MRVYLAALLLYAASLCAPPAAGAQQVEPFRFEPRLEIPLLVVGALGWTVSEQLKPRIAPSECRFCAIGPVDAAGQRALRWTNYDRAARASDWLLFGVVPVVMLSASVASALYYATPYTALVDAMVIVESLVLTANLTQLTKYIAGRARPYVATQRAENRDFVASPDDFLSFFSGHTSATFTLAVSAGMTATLRGYRAAPAIWAVGLPLAALTGYLRMGADRHYLLDVFTGALLGSAVGVLVPFLHARNATRSAPTMSVSPPAQLSLTWHR